MLGGNLGTNEIKLVETKSRYYIDDVGRLRKTSEVAGRDYIGFLDCRCVPTTF